MPPPIRVLLVDDHEVFVDALAICLGDYPDLSVVGVATSLQAGLDLLDEVDHDAIVLDLDLQGEDGLGVAREALRRNPRVGVVVATGAEANDQIVEAVQMGVRGWVAKTVTMNLICLEHLGQSMVGNIAGNASFARIAHPPARYSKITLDRASKAEP